MLQEARRKVQSFLRAQKNDVTLLARSAEPLPPTAWHWQKPRRQRIQQFPIQSVVKNETSFSKRWTTHTSPPFMWPVHGQLYDRVQFYEMLRACVPLPAAETGSALPGAWTSDVAAPANAGLQTPECKHPTHILPQPSPCQSQWREVRRRNEPPAASCRARMVSQRRKARRYNELGDVWAFDWPSAVETGAASACSM